MIFILPVFCVDTMTVDPCIKSNMIFVMEKQIKFLEELQYRNIDLKK